MTRWLFEAGADLYAWMTAQPAWRQSCRELAAQLPTSTEPMRVVDLGCGAGVAALELARLRPRDTVAGVSMDADRAARQIVDSIRRGVAERVLSMPAKVAAVAGALAPGLTAELLAGVARRS